MATYKVGDKVRIKRTDYDGAVAGDGHRVGDINTVVEVFNHGLDLRWDNDGRESSLYYHFYEVEPYVEPASSDPLTTQEGGSHYKDMAIQPIQYCLANNIPFAEGNVIKYVSRWRKKGGVQDLKKARHMLDVIIAQAEKEAAQ